MGQFSCLFKSFAGEVEARALAFDPNKIIFTVFFGTNFLGVFFQSAIFDLDEFLLHLLMRL